ncbi:MAG TPA: HAD family phosphatase [Flavitalea sp.]|nr:HAD family phosphatase [Flavitalea sp.]
MMEHKIDLTGVQSIIFDLGGVILDIDIPKTKKAFEDLGVKDFSKFFGIGHASSIFKDQETGRISDDDFIEALNKMGNSRLTKDDVLKAWNAMLIRFPPARIELLKRLRKKHRLFLFSNTNSIHLQAFQQMFIREFGYSLEDLFEKVYYSHVIGLRKPDAASFEYILNDSRLSAGETLFIDDAENNIEGAKAVGLQTFYLQKGLDIVDVFLI